MDSATCYGGRRQPSHGDTAGGFDEESEEQFSQASVNGFPASETASEKWVEGCGFSTPRGLKFRIPEKLQCPPAPKKRRLADSGQYRSTRRAVPAVSFFTHPDMELFFLAAHGGFLDLQWLKR
ncbi:hypothetical protein KSP39_PZI019764 [Platanthera zijinensis]|uniref:Uncharacterized protein n=1 Tax=Platanthera zijinensis TaxID=2320716 RepID=A0AAP0FXW8_9ASPA